MIKIITTGPLSGDAEIKLTTTMPHREYLSFNIETISPNGDKTFFIIRSWDTAQYPSLRFGVWVTVFGELIVKTPNENKSSETKLFIVADMITVCTISNEKTADFSFNKL